MRKWCIVCAIMLTLSVSALSATAHLTGAFADYLAVVYDKKTIAALTQELDDTKKEMDTLTPKVEKLEQQFSQQQDIAIDQLLGYSDVGLDTWYTMLVDNRDVVDLLGDQWIMQKAIAHYMTSVDELYVVYQDVKLQQEMLMGHEQLLEMIQQSLTRRDTYLAENEGLPLENIANYLDIDWTSEIEEPIIASMKRDSIQLEENFSSFIEKKNGNYHISEEKLNNYSHSRYFLRADHVYVQFNVNKEQVLLIGQVLQNKEGTAATLQFEAGYYNGFFLPEENLVEIPAVVFSYEQLKALPGITTPYLKQANGSLEVKTK